MDDKWPLCVCVVLCVPMDIYSELFMRVSDSDVEVQDGIWSNGD